MRFSTIRINRLVILYDSIGFDCSVCVHLLLRFSRRMLVCVCLFASLTHSLFYFQFRNVTGAYVLWMFVESLNSKAFCACVLFSINKYNNIYRIAIEIALSVTCERSIFFYYRIWNCVIIESILGVHILYVCDVLEQNVFLYMSVSRSWPCVRIVCSMPCGWCCCCFCYSYCLFHALHTITVTRVRPDFKMRKILTQLRIARCGIISTVYRYRVFCSFSPSGSRCSLVSR